MRSCFRLLVAACFGCLAFTMYAQQSRSSCAATEQNVRHAPCIDKIDPPNWWLGMPSPMLLAHGEGLNHARFSVRGKHVLLLRTQTSANGHWAFLWLDTQSASPQTLTIDAVDKLGKATASYVLSARSADPGAHAGFSSSDVLYLIMTDRFAHGHSASEPAGDNRALPRGWHGGNLTGIEQHIGYLKQLGVTAVWTTPVDSNGAMPESYHGYAATDLYSVDPHFGTLAEYRQLSDALHAHGIKLVFDFAPNHIGVLDPWVLDPPAPKWLHGSLRHHRNAGHDFYQLIDPHAPPRNRLRITDGWFNDEMPDLNQENPLVEKYLIQNALWWVEMANLDGIRIDTLPYVSRAFWHDLDATLHSVYPHLTTVGEIYDGDPEVTSFFAGGVAHNGIDTGLGTPFDFPVYFALCDVLAHDKPMTELAKVLRQDALYPHPERLVTFIGNHDTKRFLTEAGGSVPKLKLAIGLVLTLRGMPMIYSGDEIAMSGGADPDNRRDFPGGFAGDLQNAFAASGRSATQEGVFRWTSGLITFRNTHVELKTGIEQNLFVDADSFAFVRGENAAGCLSAHTSERLLVVVNKAQRARTIEIPVDKTALAGCTEFNQVKAAPGAKAKLSGGKLRVEEPAASISIFAVR